VVKTALTGLAIGDALGMPFEDSALLSRELLRWDGTFRPGSGNLKPPLNPGQWTDDTHAARALASSLVGGGGRYDRASAARHYVAWYESGDLRGAGAALCLALRRLHRGTPVGQAATPASRGSSPAKRVAPLGLAYCHDLGLVAKLARVDARITHVTDEAVEGAVAVAVAVAALAAGAGKHELLDAIVPLLEASGVRTSILRTRQSIGLTEPSRALVSLGTSKRAAQTVATAVYSFLHTSSFREAVELAVRAAGNTDTRAAIAGALAGTYYGYAQVFPYLDELEDASHLLDLDTRLNAAAMRLAG
jgi:poly(ADP-ribose) glycohydrolase ARH3